MDIYELLSNFMRFMNIYFSRPKSKEQMHVKVLCERKLLIWVKCFSGLDGSLAMARVDQTLINSVFEVQGWGEVGLGSSLWIP